LLTETKGLSLDMSQVKATTIEFVIDESSTQHARIQLNTGDKFFLSVAEAARACKAFDQAKEFSPQFDNLLAVLGQWIEDHRDRIANAHLNIREHDLLFVAVQKQMEYDRELADALTQLDLSVANSADLSLIELNVMAIPPVSADACKAFMASGAWTYAK
jgi:hypothetical protein